MQSAKDGGDVVMFTHPHQDPGSAVLNILKPLEALARDPDEECVTVVQPGGDKGMDELLCSGMGERWSEFGNITEVKEGSFADVGYVVFKTKMGVEPDTQISD